MMSRLLYVDVRSRRSAKSSKKASAERKRVYIRLVNSQLVCSTDVTDVSQFSWIDINDSNQYDACVLDLCQLNTIHSSTTESRDQEQSRFRCTVSRGHRVREHSNIIVLDRRGMSVRCTSPFHELEAVDVVNVVMKLTYYLLHIYVHVQHVTRCLCHY